MSHLDFATFHSQFCQKVDENGIDWQLVGFYAPNGRVYPFGTDTKVISTIFEALAAPIIKEIAEDHGYTVQNAEQTIYPDFTLTPPTQQPPRIAIDVKTTYRRFQSRGLLQPFRYTLGSFTSFLRTPGAKKNILHPYSEYSDHWVLGFLYTRTEGVASKVHYRPHEISELVCPYREVEFFLQEKYKIIGVSPGSGNTANIGSFSTSDINDLRQGKGPFAALGKEVCDEYWRNYGRTAAERAYADVESFLEWRRTNSVGGPPSE